MNKERTTLVWGLGLLGLLVAASFWLGVNRIFQVDEVLYAALARFMATGRTAAFVPNVPIILIGPLTWIAGAARDSAEVLIWVRMPFVILMWVNALLMVKAAGFRLRSKAGLGALLLAATLAPMWDYGFEIRHDVPLVTATLALFCLVRSERLSLRPRLFLAALLGGLMQMIAFKGFMFAMPLLALGVLLARPRGARQVLEALGVIMAGVALGLLLGRIVFGLSGTWPLAWGAFKTTSRMASTTVERFAPWATLLRLLNEMPLLACAALAAMVAPWLGAREATLRERLAAPWFPAWCFAALCVAMLFANPTPFAYNLIHLVPALYVLALALREPLSRGLTALSAPMRALVIGTLVLLHGLPWAVATSRHFQMDNDRQCTVIAAAEAMTDPALHRVFDGAGLVSCRDPLGEHWLIHSFTIQNFVNGTWPTVRAMLARNPTPVILPNYRTSWLPKDDQTFIGTHYCALAEDFLVLGGIMESGPGTWQALAEGRYQLDLAGPPATNPAVIGVDGRQVPPGLLNLTKGEHRFQVPPGHRLRVAWVGPRLSALPLLGAAPHPLFINWY